MTISSLGPAGCAKKKTTGFLISIQDLILDIRVREKEFARFSDIDPGSHHAPARVREKEFARFSDIDPGSHHAPARVREKEFARFSDDD
jgi:hypothetical protein